MKISSFEPKTAAAALSAERKTPSRGDAAAGATDSAKVTLSDAATTRLDALGDGSFDAEKVERIARAIREGRFMVNPGIIADKLIANAQELVARASR